MLEVHDAAYWRSKAEETRAIAAGMQDPTAKTTMLNVADSYDRMARHVDAIKERFPNAFVKPITPALAVEYAGMLGLPSFPEIDAMLMMRPDPLASMEGSTAFAQ